MDRPIVTDMRSRIFFNIITDSRSKYGIGASLLKSYTTEMTDIIGNCSKILNLDSSQNWATVTPVTAEIRFKFDLSLFDKITEAKFKIVYTVNRCSCKAN